MGEKTAGAERRQVNRLDKLELHWDGANGVLRARFQAQGPAELWVARHSKGIVESRWEPFDQPSSCAYVPLGLRDMKVNMPCEDGGRILIAPWGSFSMSKDAFEKIALAAEIIVPAAQKQACLAELERVVTIEATP